MVPSKHLFLIVTFFSIIAEYFVLINIRELENTYFCVVAILGSQETLKSSHLKNVFFLLYIVETTFGNANTKFRDVFGQVIMT